MPAIRVRPALPSDAAALQQIRYAAFRPTPISQGLWPGEMSEDAKAKAIATIVDETKVRGTGDSSHLFVLVAELLPDGSATDEPDADLLRSDYASDPAPIPGAEIIGFSKWSLHATPRDAAEWDVDPPTATPETHGEGMNLELWDAFIGEMKRMRRRYIGGSAHFCESDAKSTKNADSAVLDFLATAPEKQRMGAAGALIRWGTARADARGLDCWIEATPAGYPLYRRHGWRDVAVLDLDMVGRFGLPPRPEGVDWGVNNGLDVATPEQAARPDGWYRTVLMRRPAAK